MSHWVLDVLMELINKNLKEMNFSNTIAGWQLNSQNIMLVLTSRSFMMNEYKNRHVLEVQNAKNYGMDEYVDMSQKVNTNTKSTLSKRLKEKIMYQEILSL